VCGVRETLSVYVVDDDNAVRDSLTALLEPEGFVVSSYSSAEEFLKGLEKFDGSGRGCLLLDLHMPGQGGQELLDFLGSHEKNLPVIVMTGNANDRSRRRALESGAADFLEKPVDADQLIKSLLTALDEPQLRTNGQ
jgi:FixJ family two-component response regulator